MKTLIKMAFRDLGRNRRRSLFSMLALGMGLALLLLIASIYEGQMRLSLDTAIRLQTGHLQVRAANYNENKTSLAWEDLVADPQLVASQVASLPAVELATPRLYASGILSLGEKTNGVRVIGIDPDSTANQPFRLGLVSGEFITAEDRQGLLLGQPLADKLQVEVGDQVNLLVNTASGEVDEQNFTVRGIYDTHTPGYDRSTVFLPLAKAQAITQSENHASIIFILLKDRDLTGAVVNALSSSPYQVVTWEKMNELVLQTEEFSNAFLYVLYLIVLGITATVIVNTLVMAVFERTREIGILSAVGMKSNHIMAMFFIESSMLAIGGIIIGLILGGLMAWYAKTVGFYIGDMGVTGMLYGDRLYGHLVFEDIASASLVAFIITLVASLYPAILAARMEPVEALHGGKQL
ncbi:MAG: ABC transporter permease [Anaerolineae bacterium]|nr:ABC transporter permease [Anaerolineae bacterium]